MHHLGYSEYPVEHAILWFYNLSLYQDYTVVPVMSLTMDTTYSVVNSAVRNSTLTPLFVRERVCWRPHDTLITSTFRPGNMPICCGQLYLDMVGPVPGYREVIVLKVVQSLHTTASSWLYSNGKHYGLHFGILTNQHSHKNRQYLENIMFCEPCEISVKTTAYLHFHTACKLKFSCSGN